MVAQTAARENVVVWKPCEVTAIQMYVERCSPRTKILVSHSCVKLNHAAQIYQP